MPSGPAPWRACNQKLSDTRWACREKVLKALLKVMSSVVKVLSDITEKEPPDTAAEDARMCLKAIDFEFLLCFDPLQSLRSLHVPLMLYRTLILISPQHILLLMELWKPCPTSGHKHSLENCLRVPLKSAEAAGISIPTVPPGQKRQRMVLATPSSQ